MSFLRLRHFFSSRNASMRLSAGSPHPLGRHLGRARHELRAILRQRAEGRALPVRQLRAGASSNASPCPSAPRTSGTAISPMSCRASSMAIACTDPMSRNAASASMPTSCCRPLRKAAGRTLGMERRAFWLSRRASTRGSVFRSARQCPRHAQGGRGRSGLHLGRGTPAFDPLGRYDNL